MDKLPTEILVSIFNHLPQSDLVTATQVCKKFCEIIENCRLIRQIFIDENCDSSPGRKYTEAIVKRYVPDVHQKVFETIGNQLKMLKFTRCSLNLADILKILQSATNVENLTFSYVRMEDDKIESSAELPQLKNVNLLFEESDPLIFSILSKTSFAKMDLRFFADVPYSNFSYLVNLLKTQDKLTSLAFSGIYESNLFLIPMGKANYRLKEFYIDNCDLEEWDGLETYLAEHVGTLEKFTVKNLRWDPSQSLNYCKNLKSLEVKQTEVNFLGILKSLEQLSVEPPIRTMDIFPNVKQFFIGRSSPQVNQTASTSMENVEELELKFSEVGGISFPSLRKLKLSSISGVIGDDFFTLHSKIQDLTLLHYFDLNDALLENISTALKDLKVLRILGDNFLTSRAFTIIGGNCKNLKVFEMTHWSQKFKKEDWKVLSEINGLKVHTENF